MVILRDLPDSAFTSIVAELERSPDTIPTAPGLSELDAELLKDSIDAMYAVRAYHGVPLDEFVDDIIEALKFNKELNADAVAPMHNRLLAILDVSPLRVSAKAALLHAEHEHTYCTSRIFTDIRPVYDNGVNIPPSGAIITHTLKLSYHESASGDIHEIFVALGSDDIRELQDVLNRATDKAGSLKGVLETSKLRYIDPQL
jgi:hypothetical protein